MTEEIKIGKKDVAACNYWKACDYYKQLKRLEQEHNTICYNLGLLEQENKELHAYKDINEDFKKAWDELNEKYKQLRSALEEIKRTVMDIIEDNGRHNLSDFSSPIRIEKIINEVLND